MRFVQLPRSVNLEARREIEMKMTRGAKGRERERGKDKRDNPGV